MVATAKPQARLGVSEFDSSVYGPAFAELISAERVMPLNEGRPPREAQPALEQLTVERAFSHADVTDTDMARCCLSGVWLLHDFLDESHTISQEIGTPSGSYWHGIMHRREGDFSNAHYWFHRVGDHPVFTRLAMGDGSSWDAERFVDHCSRALRSQDSDKIAELRQLQQREWQALFDFCYRAAVGERGT
jgi:hypothetical protein